MREYRVVLLTKREDSQSIRDAWQEAVNKHGALDLSRCHVQIVDDKYAVCRWDWTMLGEHDKADFINTCERSGCGYQFMLIGKNGLDDVEDHLCHSRCRLPVRLEARVTVSLVDDE